MSDELKENEKNECKCLCKSKEFKSFLVIALGSFVGVYFALSLFAALHRPPMMSPCAFKHQGVMRGCPVKMIHHHFDKPPRPDFHNGVKEQQFPAPFESGRNMQNK